MREKVIEVIYSAWCDGLLQPEGYHTTVPEIKELVKDFSERFHCSAKETDYIDTEMFRVLNILEHKAFKEAFAICLELVNGNLLKD